MLCAGVVGSEGRLVSAFRHDRICNGRRETTPSSRHRHTLNYPPTGRRPKYRWSGEHPIDGVSVHRMLVGADCGWWRNGREEADSVVTPLFLSWVCQRVFSSLWGL